MNRKKAGIGPFLKRSLNSLKINLFLSGRGQRVRRDRERALVERGRLRQEVEAVPFVAAAKTPAMKIGRVMQRRQRVRRYRRLALVPVRGHHRRQRRCRQEDL